MIIFAYLADVFILDSFRGQGLGVWLMEVVIAHPDVQGLRRWLLQRYAERLSPFQVTILIASNFGTV